MEKATSTTKTFYEGVEQAGVFAGGSERGVRRMELALGAMAAESVGAGHALGTLTEGLLLFGGGSVVTVAALAGIAAIGGALHLLSAESKAAQQATDDLEKSLRQFGTHGTIEALRIQFGTLQQQMKELAAQRMALINSGSSRQDLDVQLIEAKMIRVLQQEATLRTEIARETQKFNDEEANKANARRLADDEFISRMGERLQKIQEEINKELELNQVMLSNMVIMQEAARQGPVAEGLAANRLAAGTFGGNPISEEDLKDIDKSVDKTVDAAQKALDKMQDVDDKMQRSFYEAGYRSMEALVQGMLNGTKDFGKLIEQTLLHFAFRLGEIAIFGSGGLLGGAAGGLLSGGGGGGGLLSSFQGAGRLNMNVTVPAGSTPFDAARDAQWQNALRESATVAGSQGFSFP